MLAAVAACGAEPAREPGAARAAVPATAPAPPATLPPSAGATSPATSPAQARTGAAAPTAASSPGTPPAADGWCALRPAWTCPDAAVARRWWPVGQFPVPAGQQHTYVAYGRRGTRLDAPPSADRGSQLSLVLHDAAPTPREVHREQLERRGAIVVSVRLTREPRPDRRSPGAKTVIVRGREAMLLTHPTRPAHRSGW